MNLSNRSLVPCVLVAAMFFLGGRGAMASDVPSSSDWDSWRSYTQTLPACGIARGIDDYNQSPKVVSVARQEQRANAYVACRKALHGVHASAGALKVNTLLLGRACLILGMTGGPAGTLAACN